MMQLIETLDDVEAGVITLIARDPQLADVYRITGLPPLRRQAGGYAALLYMITEQMISLKAAAAIWQRTHDAFHPFDPAAMATAPNEAYRQCGLSGPKLKTMRSLAEAVNDGRVDFEALGGLDDDGVARCLTQVKGIGGWTAQVYLLACLGRPDAWPAGDVALQSATKAALQLPERPGHRQMVEIAESWRPLRAIAARLLWAYYRHLN